MIRARGLLAATLMIALAGCGGSVADRDRPAPRVEEPEPPSPFCAAIFASSEALTPLNALAAGGSIPPDQLDTTVEQVRTANSDLLAATPTDIRTDVQTYVRIIELQLDAVVAGGGAADALAPGTPLAAQINTPENADANERLREYVTRSCAASGGVAD